MTMNTFFKNIQRFTATSVGMIAAAALSLTVSPAIVQQAMAATTAASNASDYTLLEPLPCIPSQPTVENGVTVNPGVQCPGNSGNSVVYEKSVNFQQYIQY